MIMNNIGKNNKKQKERGVFPFIKRNSLLFRDYLFFFCYMHKTKSDLIRDLQNKLQVKSFFIIYIEK